MILFSLHPQLMKKPRVIFGHHDTEADVLSVQTLEGGAVAYHEPVFDAAFEYIEGSHALFQDPQQDKVRVRMMCLIVRISGQRLSQCCLRTRGSAFLSFSGENPDSL